MNKPASLRETMPTVTAWIDGLRDVFGREDIDAVIRSGVRGVPGFYARENGIEVGTAPTAARVEFALDRLVVIKPEGKGGK